MDVNTGDATLQLMWRLRNGESPHALAPKIAVVLIGTNDLGYASVEVSQFLTCLYVSFVYFNVWILYTVALH